MERAPTMPEPEHLLTGAARQRQVSFCTFAGVACRVTATVTNIQPSYTSHFHSKFQNSSPDPPSAEGSDRGISFTSSLSAQSILAKSTVLPYTFLTPPSTSCQVSRSPMSIKIEQYSASNCPPLLAASRSAIITVPPGATLANRW